MGNKITNIKERIRKVAEDKGVSYSYLYGIIEMTDGSFKGNALNRPINSNAIVKLITEFPDIDLHWLITGEEKNIEKQDVLNEPAETYNKTENIIAYEMRRIVREENAQIFKEIDEINNKINALLVINKIDEELLDSKFSALVTELRNRNSVKHGE